MRTLENNVFVSYAWGGESERIVNEIDATLQEKGIKLIRDKRDLGFKGSIKEFMERIGRGNCIIVVISEKYLCSENCMFELMEIAENQNFYSRIFPIILKDADIYKAINRIKYIKHWDEKIAELNSAIKTVAIMTNIQSILDDINIYGRIRATIDSLTNVLKDMNTLTPEMHEDSNFSQLIEALIPRLNKPLEDSKLIVNIPDYPYEEFATSFRNILAPKRYTASNSVLNLVFGNIANIRETTVTLPINQSFDFMQRGPRSVLVAFERIKVGSENFYDALEEIWEVDQRPSQAGIGQTKLIQLPANSHSLKGVIFAVTTRNISEHGNYGRYVNTPIEGIDYVLDKILETAKENKINSIALPLLGTGYANVDISLNNPELRLLIQQLALAITIHKLENYLSNKESDLKRGIIVVYSSQPQSADENSIWEFAIKLLKKEQDKRSEQIDQLIDEFSQKRLGVSKKTIGSVYLSANSYNKNASEGEIVEFPIAIRHDIRGNSAVNIIVTPRYDTGWKFSLSYGTDYFESDGHKPIKNRIDLLLNTSMEVRLKVFIPKHVGETNLSTHEVQIESTTLPKVVNSANFMITIK